MFAPPSWQARRERTLASLNEKMGSVAAKLALTPRKLGSKLALVEMCDLKNLNETAAKTPRNGFALQNHKTTQNTPSLRLAYAAPQGPRSKLSLPHQGGGGNLASPRSLWGREIASGIENRSPPSLWGREFANGIENRSPPSLWGRVREGGRIAQWQAKPHGGFERTQQRLSNAYGRGCAAGNSTGISFAARRPSEGTSSISSVPSAGSSSKSMVASMQGRLGAMRNARRGWKVRDTRSFDSGTTMSLEILTGWWKPSSPHFAKSKHTPSPALPHQGGGSNLASSPPPVWGGDRFPCADREHA